MGGGTPTTLLVSNVNSRSVYHLRVKQRVRRVNSLSPELQPPRIRGKVCSRDRRNLPGLRSGWRDYNLGVDRLKDLREIFERGDKCGGGSFRFPRDNPPPSVRIRTVGWFCPDPVGSVRRESPGSFPVRGPGPEVTVGLSPQGGRDQQVI